MNKPEVKKFYYDDVQQGYWLIAVLPSTNEEVTIFIPGVTGEPVSIYITRTLLSTGVADGNLP